MLRCILLKPGSIGLEDVPSPSPSKGELLIQVKAALTCGTDLKAFLRGHPVIPMPGPFGHEFSGVVAGAGAGVRGFKEGDEVMAVHSAPCLECRFCKRGLYNLCENIMRTKVLGAFAQYVLLPPHIVRQNVYLKPPGLSFEEAALLEPLSCVIHGASEVLKTRPGLENALVLGAGPIGLIHLLLLKGKRVSVAVSDPNSARLRAANALGADFAIKPEALAEGIKGRKSGACGPFDAVFECTGRPEVWESTVNYLRRGGTAVLFGGCPMGTKVTFDTRRLHYDEITLKGVFHFTPKDVGKAYELLKGRTIPFSRLISGRYPLKDIKKAFGSLKEGKGIKYAIVP